MSDVDFHALNETIENFENYSTNRKFNVASNVNAFGFEPFMWNSGGTIYQAAAIEKDARFDELSTLGNFGIGTIPDTGWGTKIAMEGQFNAYEKFVISTVGPYTGLIVGNVYMSDDTTFVLTDLQEYGPVMLNMGAGSFSVALGVAGVQGDHFHLGDVSYPLIITPSAFAVNSTEVNISNGANVAIKTSSGNVGIGVTPTEKVCIKFPEHEIKFYDCIHFAESTPETTSMYLMYKIGTSLYKIPCYGAD
jgi:hypothetical protein